MSNIKTIIIPSDSGFVCSVNDDISLVSDKYNEEAINIFKKIEVDKWVKTCEHPPEKDTPVLMYMSNKPYGNNYMWVGCRMGTNKIEFYDKFDNIFQLEEVLFWRPLPELPKIK